MRKKHKKIAMNLFVVFVLLCCLSCSMDLASSKAKGQVLILSYGLGYENTKVTSLDGTMEDAAEFAMCFSDIYSVLDIPCTVKLSVDEIKDFTSAEVVQTLQNLNLSEEDLLIFYFSGHGGTDIKGTFLVFNGDEENMYTKLYVQTLYENIKNLNSRSAVILDCCYAGAMTDYTLENKNFCQSLETLFSKDEKNRISVIASSSRDETSVVSAAYTEEGYGESHSLFTIFLLKTLGWKHSRNCFNYLDGTKVYGFLSSCPGKMTSNELYGKSIRNWPIRSQIPQINRTDVPVVLIPAKGGVL